MEKSEKNLPLGTGKEFIKERRKETLPAVEIKNKIIWINPAFQETVPLKLKLGEPAKLGLFFTPGVGVGQENTKLLQVSPEIFRGRSGLVGAVIFEDQYGLVYRDLDLKGVGVFGTKVGGGYYVRPVKKMEDEYMQGESEGIMDYEDAVQDAVWSEEFLKRGIRTHRAVAILELDEIVDADGNKISIEEAKKRDLIVKDSRPVIEIRAFGTKERVAHIVRPGSIVRAQAALADARALVAAELGKTKEEFGWQEYLEWFAKTLGEEVAKLKRSGIYHDNLTMQNITLDCRIVDLDTALKMEDAVAKFDGMKTKESPKRAEEELYRNDYVMAKDSLIKFFIALADKPELGVPLETENVNKLLEVFKDTYRKKLEIK